ncbi:hypothetical protein Mal15_56480 [Stieleria maiorica]|uniref:Uncharacterized protein n=1 Tax=Stieleria maiorica TaxID=2795974 RepID=A0A5B9MNC8_9BACT|nr:hypothetical protein Mal15_56480 [Stieleria maiorica]
MGEKRWGQNDGGKTMGAGGWQNDSGQNDVEQGDGRMIRGRMMSNAGPREGGFLDAMTKHTPEIMSLAMDASGFPAVGSRRC